ncbi:MAG: zinc-ribbon domain-containing protein [Candidatus Bathyarchaeota archaeon]
MIEHLLKLIQGLYFQRACASGVFEKGTAMGLMGSTDATPPPPPPKPVCPSCGSDIVPGHKFCTKCGAHL